MTFVSFVFLGAAAARCGWSRTGGGRPTGHARVGRRGRAKMILISAVPSDFKHKERISIPTRLFTRVGLKHLSGISFGSTFFVSLFLAGYIEIKRIANRKCQQFCSIVHEAC